MAEVKLIAKHGDFTIEIKGKNVENIVTLYQELRMRLEVVKREG